MAPAAVAALALPAFAQTTTTVTSQPQQQAAPPPPSTQAVVNPSDPEAYAADPPSRPMRPGVAEQSVVAVVSGDQDRHRGLLASGARSLQFPSLEVLFDVASGELVAEYGGNPRWSGVAVNSVESLDGVVALPDAGGESGGVVSGGSKADRFVMGLLRSCADAVLIGAGTLRAAPRDLWFADSVFPEAAELYARVGRLRPPLYVVSGSGQVDPALPAIVQGGTLLTGKLAPHEIVQRVRDDGHERILCEGGPGLFGELAAAGLVDEIFLTLSPRLFGRFAGDGRKALAEARDLRGLPLRLLSLRRAESHLFLRYSTK